MRRRRRIAGRLRVEVGRDKVVVGCRGMKGGEEDEEDQGDKEAGEERLLVTG
jgi:hypothetical protein